MTFCDTINGYYVWSINVAAGLAVLIIIWNGYRLIVSSGDAEIQKDARDWIIGALTGLALLVMAGVVWKMLRSSDACKDVFEKKSFLLIPVVSAAIFNIGDSAALFPDTNAVSNAVFSKIINLLVGSAGAMATIYLIISGFRYLTNAGNEEETTKAKKAMLWAIIGLVVVFAAYGFLSWLLGEINK